jgi:hypothetical protein
MLTLKDINCTAPPTAYFKCLDTEYEEMYDWLVRATTSKKTSFYLVRCNNMGWVKYEDTKMVEEFLEENSF